MSDSNTNAVHEETTASGPRDYVHPLQALIDAAGDALPPILCCLHEGKLPRPLAPGIRYGLISILIDQKGIDPQIAADVVQAALKYVSGGVEYLRGLLAEDAWRYDIQGIAVERVSDADRAYASTRLASIEDRYSAETVRKHVARLEAAVARLEKMVAKGGAQAKPAKAAAAVGAVHAEKGPQKAPEKPVAPGEPKLAALGRPVLSLRKTGG
jgi:sRNA-binding protein